MELVFAKRNLPSRLRRGVQMWLWASTPRTTIVITWFWMEPS